MKPRSRSSEPHNGAPGSSISFEATMRILGMTKIAAAGVVLVAGLSGCTQKKITECNALITVINSGVTALERTPKTESDTTGAADLKTMADAMEKVADDAAKVSLTIPELKRFAVDYQKMVKDIAKAERQMASAAEERDLQKRTSAEEALSSAVKQEDPLVDSINRFCQGQ